MAVVAAVLTIEDTPTLISSGGASTDKKTVIIRGASGTIFLGGLSVDASDGIPVNENEIFSLDLGSQDDLYGICASGTETINVIITRS